MYPKLLIKSELVITLKFFLRRWCSTSPPIDALSLCFDSYRDQRDEHWRYQFLNASEQIVHKKNHNDYAVVFESSPCLI